MLKTLYLIERLIIKFEQGGQINIFVMLSKLRQTFFASNPYLFNRMKWPAFYQANHFYYRGSM